MEFSQIADIADGFAGTRQWWRDFADTRGLSPIMMRAIGQALSASDKS